MSAPALHLRMRAGAVEAPARAGMILLVVTEGAFFVYLLFSYLYLLSMGSRGAAPPAPPELRLASLNTVLLLASSGTMWWADSGIRRGAQRRLRLSLLATLLLGIAFLAIQGVEYSHQRFSPSSSAYGSLFFTVTGFHGAHVLAGLLMIAFVTARAWAGHFAPRRHLAVSNVALYWHFVDVVWLAVFTTLYVAPHLAGG